MSVITRLCSKMEPNDAAMAECSGSLGALLEHEDLKVCCYRNGIVFPTCLHHDKVTAIYYIRCRAG